MTQNETTAIMAVLYAAYPQFYAKKMPAEIDSIVALWTEMFADDSAEIVAAAVKSFIATDTKGYPPAIGIIKGHVSKIKYGYQKTELEAWGEVQEALRNSAYGAGEEFRKLDPIIQRIVGSPSQLREWAMAESGTSINVIASNFQRSYKAISENQREYRALPGPIAEIVNQIAEKKKLIPEPQPKTLPVNIQETVDKSKRVVENPLAQEIHIPLSPEEFEKRRTELLEILCNK